MFSASIEEAVRAGSSQGKQELTEMQRRNEEAGRLQETSIAKAFDAAAGVIEGLTILRALPGSAFTFNAAAQCGQVYITTNIPVRHRYRKDDPSLEIFAEPNDTITAYGDKHGSGPADRIKVNTGDPKAVEEFVSYVAKMATKRGLIH